MLCCASWRLCQSHCIPSSEHVTHTLRPCWFHCNVQVLNNLKFRLGDLVAMGLQLRRMITERTSELSKFETGLVSVSDEKTVAERTVRRLKAEQDDM